jgi:hypothetical protein
VGVSRALGESVEVEKVTAESLGVYTFFEVLNVMNLISPAPADVDAVCKRIV